MLGMIASALRNFTPSSAGGDDQDMFKTMVRKKSTHRFTWHAQQGYMGMHRTAAEGETFTHLPDDLIRFYSSGACW